MCGTRICYHLYDKLGGQLTSTSHDAHDVNRIPMMRECVCAGRGVCGVWVGGLVAFQWGFHGVGFREIVTGGVPRRGCLRAAR